MRFLRDIDDSVTLSENFTRDKNKLRFSLFSELTELRFQAFKDRFGNIQLEAPQCICFQRFSTSSSHGFSAAMNSSWQKNGHNRRMNRMIVVTYLVVKVFFLDCILQSDKIAKTSEIRDNVFILNNFLLKLIVLN